VVISIVSHYPQGDSSGEHRGGIAAAGKGKKGMGKGKKGVDKGKKGVYTDPRPEMAAVLLVHSLISYTDRIVQLTTTRPHTLPGLSSAPSQIFIILFPALSQPLPARSGYPLFRPSGVPLFYPSGGPLLSDTIVGGDDGDSGGGGQLLVLGSMVVVVVVIVTSAAISP
jgi:hypothetical protein